MSLTCWSTRRSTSASCCWKCAATPAAASPSAGAACPSPARFRFLCASASASCCAPPPPPPNVTPLSDASAAHSCGPGAYRPVGATCRGPAAAEEAAETARRTFEEGQGGDSLPRFAVDGPVALVDALVGLGFAKSKGEARRLIAGGGARVDGEKVADEAAMLTVGDAPLRLSAGKKHHGLLTRR